MAQVIEINDGDTVNVIEVQLPFYGVASSELEFGARAAQALTLGDVVYVSGATGTHIQVSKAQANAENTSAGTIGIAKESAALNGDLQVLTFGIISNLNTSAYTAGQVLYLSTSVAGGYQTTLPAAPNHGVKLGWVVRSHPSQGQIFVAIQNYQELEELSDVSVAGVTDGQVLTYQSSSGTWVPGTPNPGDITAVNVTSPITGGGTSGAVTVGINQSALSLTASQISDGSTTWARLAASNTFTVGQLIQTGAAATVGLRVRGAASQTANLQEWQNDSGTILTRITSAGNLQAPIVGVGGTALDTLGGTLRVMNAGAAAIGITVRGAASQSANLQEWQDSSGNVYAIVSPFGQLSIGQSPTIYSNARISLNTVAATAVGQVIRGAASQTANLLEIQNSASSILWRVDAAGQTTAVQYSTSNNLGRIGEASSGGFLRLARMTAQASSPGANVGTLYLRDGTNAGTLKLVVRAGAAGAETTILDNIPQ
jgi:hypothetical protein